MHNTGVKRSLRNFDSVVFKEDLEMVDWNVAHTQSEENCHVNLFQSVDRLIDKDYPKKSIQRMLQKIKIK